MSRLSASSRKQSSESVSSSYADTSIGSSSLVSSKNERLKFLRKSLLKRATTSFINLYSYLFSVLPIHSFIYDFMFCLRLIQLFVPSIFYANPVLYISGTPQYKVGVFLTIFTRLFPIGSDLDGQIIFGWIYVAFFIFYISCLSLCAYYFAKKSTLPSVVPSILCYTFTIVEHLPHCWAMSLLGYITSLDTDTLTNEQIALSFFLALTFVLFSVIHQMLNIASIFFTPLAFKTVNPWPQSTLTYITALICFISEFSGHYQKNKIVQIVLMVVVLLLYIFIFFLLETKAYFLNGFQGSTFCAVCDACIIFSVISIIYMIVEKPVHDFIFLIVSLSIILFTILNFQLRSRRFIKSLSILDYLEEDKSNYSMFKRSSQILPNIFIGFQTNHRYCLSYTIFRDSLNCFENDLSLLIAFAKLLAIYPEEYAQLNWVYAMLKRHPKSNFITKFIKAQLMTILMRRESTLSGDLKKKLQSISHLVSTAKLRIRNMWEAVLSGTISELEPLFLSYSTIVKQIDLKFTYLQNYHSNNQFALRALSNYERDVQANIELANYHREKVKKIKMGHTDDIDQVYLYGRIMFPMLPPRPIYQNFKTTEVHSLQNIADGESSIGSISDASINEDDEHLYIADVQTRLRNTITSMSIPSIRVSITLTFLLIFIIMLVPYIVILVMLNPIETMISDPVSYLTSIDKVHKYVLHIYGLTIRYIMESEPFNLIDLCEYFVDWEDDGGVPENIGGQCASNHMLLYFAQEATVAIGELSEMKKDKSTNEILINVKNILFKNITTFQVFTEFAVAGPPVNKSIQQYVIDSVETAIMIASDDSPFKYSTSREIVNLLINAFSFEASTLELTDDILEYLIDHTNQIKKIFTILEYTLAILFPILFLVVSAILARWVRIQKRKVYRCFYALPKTTLSKMIEAYNSTVSVDKNVNNSNAEAELEEERQEEKAITILRSGDIGNKMSRLVGIAIIGILIVLFNIVFIIYGCQYFIKNAQLFIYSSPLINYISYAYTNSFTSLLFLTIKAWKDNGFNHPAIPDAFLINYYLTKINDTTTYYNKMLYGNTNENIYTAAKFIDEFEKYEVARCDNQTIDSDDAHTMYHCLSSDSLYNYYILSLKRLYSTFPVLNIPFNLSSFDLLESWHMAIGHVYAHYLDPLMGEITDSVQHVLTNSRSDMITVLTVLLVLSIFIALFYAYQLFENEQELKSTLLLLLHAPPNEILESSYIMAIISGDFSSREESGSQVDEAVFKSITDNYPDALITFTNSGAIITKNEKAQQLLEGPEIKNDGNENNSTQPGTNQEHNDENNHNNNNIISNTTTAFVKNVPNEIVLGQTEFVLNGRTISASYSKIDSSKMLVMLNDLSRIQELGRQLEEETKRKASLISKLMPSILTPKVMSKTSNGVSFSVQSVTITMISLGLSGHDDNVFDVFNKVYQSLNSIVKHYHTIESVEIVGDVFMVVGGLFDEVNQAERHAREIIKFALEAIEKISSIKQKYCLNNEPTLCGVATGGPVSGGVIELDIPIFEVCGDVVDLADAMMIQGVPNIVHTTRSVYELIYGRDFQIKERGELTIPNFGTVVTYLVSSNTNQ